MKKYLNISLIYAFAALIFGVFYREFTKWNGYSEVTTLGKVHGHLLMLGTIVFLLVALFSTHLNLKECKMFQVFLWVYNIGIPVTTVMMVVRGITQVLNISLSNAADAAISGISGIGHIFTGVGMVLFLLSLRKTAED
ncbi:MAG: DUF2871 domain-containing protein [Oliverpabstia sp.]|nr:DUF2871 domain-containing protein [Oliverpabstia sp.]